MQGSSPQPRPHHSTHTQQSPQQSTPPNASGACVLWVCGILLGSAFVAVLVFAIITFTLKRHGPEAGAATEPPSAPNQETASTKKTDTDRELLPLQVAATTKDDLVSGDDVDRVLGSSFSPPSLELPPSLPPPALPKEKDSPPPLSPPPVKTLPDKPAPPKTTVVENNPAPPPKADPPKADPPKTNPSAADVAFEKRLQVSEEETRDQLLAVPELRLFSDLEVEAFREQEKTAQGGVRVRRGGDPVEFAFNVRLHKAMLEAGIKEGLPLKTGAGSRLAPATAMVVQTLSKNLRDLGFVSVPGTRARVIFPGKPAVAGVGIINNAAAKDKTDALKAWCDENKVEKFSGALATLLQMLQVEDVPTRLILVRELAKVKSAGATAALAKRAIVDPSPEVREAAVAALEKRPTGQYVPVLLQGLRYPWAPVADRAALALRKLKPENAVPKLVALLDQPNPALPVLDKRSKKSVVRELVRLNHMRNCFLCHVPSANDKDGLVRGLAPTPGQPLPRLYYAGQSGNFVRADTTFLRQDFSVNLPVKAAAPWPDEQRFDFITRVRKATPDELAKIAAKPNPDLNYPQREATLYVLRGITGKDGGLESDTWRDLLGIAKEKDAALDKPSKDKDPDLDKTNKDKDPSLDKPGKDKDPALDKPGKDKGPSLDKPAGNKDPALDKPARDKDKPANPPTQPVARKRPGEL